jgi:peptidoglycan hydrolase-like protein with peptidoglycan-binding domain
LDRARFSPGEIDGRYGDDLGIAINGYQEAHNLKPIGMVDADTWKLLNAARGCLLTTYVITAADERAKLKWMGYESPVEELGERFHVSPKFLEELTQGGS